MGNVFMVVGGGVLQIVGILIGTCVPLLASRDSKSKNHHVNAYKVDNNFVAFAGKVFQQIVGILIGTNCASFLADIFLYLQCGIRIVFALNEKETVTISVQF